MLLGAVCAGVAVSVTAEGAQAQSGPVRMSVTDARAAQESGDLILVDIRRPEEWAASGVPAGAERIDMRSSDFPARSRTCIAMPFRNVVSYFCLFASLTQHHGGSMRKASRKVRRRNKQ